jgi:CubicO group peptidase (beta-lactamase class C family)
MSETNICGHNHPDFSPVRHVFEEGFLAGRDVGAAVSVIVGKECVLELWGGYTDRKHTRAWEQNTLCCMYSISKAVSALCLLQAVDEGFLTLQTRVSDVWPEFKSAPQSTLSDLLSHRLGLVGFHEPVAKDIYYDWRKVCDLLVTESPWWTPGADHGYHARTLGFLIGEVLQRATGRSIGQWLQEKIATPLDLDLMISVPGAEHSRCADMLPARVITGEQRHWPPAMQEMMAASRDRNSPAWAAFQNPSMPSGYMNRPAFRSAEIPALNGHGTAQAVSKLMANLPDLLSTNTFEAARQTLSHGPDRVLKSISRFGLGFMLHDDEAPIGMRAGSMGHAGAGGSMAFYDPDNCVAFAFLMNQMQDGVVTGGTSAMALAREVYGCLG